MSAAETLLSRLERVKSRGSDTWSASCPGPMHVHGDRSSGLGIKKVDDRILIHCPAGCAPLEIVNAVGLDLKDLFERPLTDSAVTPVRQPPFPLDMARKVRHNATILLLAATDLRNQKPLSEADFKTVCDAYREIESTILAVEFWPRTAVRG